MKVRWSICLLGFLCMAVEVKPNTLTASEDPISITRVNSSAQISCNMLSPDITGLSLKRHFHKKPKDTVMYLHLTDGKIMNVVHLSEFNGRFDIDQDQKVKIGYRFTFKLSQLKQEDTDSYYCRWLYTVRNSLHEEDSNSTIIAVTDRQEQCSKRTEDLIFLALSVTAFTIVLFLFIAALTVRCRRFKKHFRPARATAPPRPGRARAAPPRPGRARAAPPRPGRPHSICPNCTVTYDSYLITAVHSDF